MQSTSFLNSLTYDVKTVTAGDYTVEMDITESMWVTFTEKEK